jgi:hypothetical protein
MSVHPRPLRSGLPPLPPKLAHLPVDARGFPVPWFVALVDGVPDHRVMDGDKMPRAIRHGLCWMCGQPLGAFKTFCIGPMCAVTRTIAEPPSHRECVRYAAQACPWLTRPRAKRREAGLPEDARDGAGLPIKRNPGVVCLWTTKVFQTFRSDAGNSGVLFHLGEPVSLEWWAEGRPAQRDEVDASIESGLPLLMAEARKDRDPEGALRDLEARLFNVARLLSESFALATAIRPAEG